MTKKICIVGPAYPYRGGIAATNERLAKAFQDQGHEVNIVTFTVQYPSILFPGKSQYDTNKSAPDLSIQRKLNSINPLSWWMTGRAIKKQNPDIVLVRYWIPFLGPALGFLLRIVKKNKLIKTVCILDNLIPHETRPGDVLFTKYFVKPVDYFISMSKSVQSELKTFSPNKKCIYTPHPLFDQFGHAIDREEALHKLKLDKDKKYLLFFGFIRAYKGLDLLLKAMAKTKDDVHLLIVGEYYEDASKYQSIIEKEKIEDRVHHFAEFVPDAEVKTYFSAADLVVQPYRTATQSGVAQIAFNFNKAILVTDVGGLSEIVSHQKSGYVSDVNSDDIALHINSHFERDDHQEMEAFIKQDKERFSWDAMTKTIYNLVE